MDQLSPSAREQEESHHARAKKFDDEVYSLLPVYKPAATRKQIEKALEMLNAAERPLIVAGGGVINADACGLLVEFAEFEETLDLPLDEVPGGRGLLLPV